MKNNTLKKLALSLLVASATTACFAQGQVNFVTYNATVTSRGNIYLAGGVTGVGAGYVAQLFIGTSSTVANLITFGGLYTLSASGAAPNPGGIVTAGVLTIPWSTDPAYDAVNNPVSAYDAGNPLWYEVRVWSSAYTTWAQALANAATSAYGSSALVKINSLGGTDIAQDPPTTPSVLNAFANFSLSAVPEPGTMALAALGGASMLLFRRRK